MKRKNTFYILLYIFLVLWLCALCPIISCATTGGAGSQTGNRGEDVGLGGPGFTLFGGALPVNTAELIGGVVVLVIILASVIIIRQIVSKKK